MLPRRPIERFRAVAAIAAAVIVAGLVGVLTVAIVTIAGPASADPVAADPVGAAAGGGGAAADLAVNVPGPEISIGAESKAVRIDVANSGPATAGHAELTVEFADLAGVRVDFDGPGCHGDVSTRVCPLDEIAPGGHDNSYGVIVTPTVDGRGGPPAPGVAGTMTVSVSATPTDPDTANNRQTVAFTLVPDRVDLTTFGTDLTLTPGAAADLPFAVSNQGSVDAEAVDVSVRLPAYVTFVPDGRPCDYDRSRTGVTCHFSGIAAGQGAADVLGVLVAPNAPGPVALTGGSIAATATVAPALSRRATGPRAAFRSRGTRDLGTDDASPGDDTFDFTVFTSRNPADLAVTSSAASGRVGATVAIGVAITNHGPADSLNTVLRVNAPTGTEFRGVAAGCTAFSAPTVYECPRGRVAAGATVDDRFTLAVLSAAGADGRAQVSGSVPDDRPANNTVPIRVTVVAGSPSPSPSGSPGPSPSGAASTPPPVTPTTPRPGGGLPVTGAPVVLIGATGLAVFVIGACLLLLARRRRPAGSVPPPDGPHIN
ncbi:MAG: hypothetical protein QOI74_2657 [Micromonosporaceae bacterium]|nr:hypothetical protein [Micromonosporaceae bacterium]